MPNPIKYSTGSESDALKKGNFYIGTGAVGKGPSDTTGYYQGPNVPTNGYVIYVNNVGSPGELSYHSAANDSELISFTNSLAGESFTAVTQCFNYYYGQTDKVLVNQDYPADFPYIVMDGLILYLDAGITQSYPESGTSWKDINGLGPKNNSLLENGPVFISSGGGSIELDGTNDVITIQNTNGIFNVGTGEFTIALWFYLPFRQSHNYIHLFAFDSQSNWAFKAGDSNFGRGIYYYGGNETFRSSLNSFGPWNISFDVWQYIAITRSSDGWTKKAYYNETYVGSYDRTPKSITCSQIKIGHAYGSEYTNQIRGPIQFYKRELSHSEVLQNFNAQKSRFGL